MSKFSTLAIHFWWINYDISDILISSSNCQYELPFKCLLTGVSHASTMILEALKMPVTQGITSECGGLASIKRCATESCNDTSVFTCPGCGWESNPSPGQCLLADCGCPGRVPRAPSQGSSAGPAGRRAETALP